MNEYQRLGNMELTNNNTHKLECYLPHHLVCKESITTTKLKEVFDALTYVSLSLNDMLMVGPNIQDNILLRFHMHVYIMSAVIEKMYRKIRVHPSQRDLLKIVWRDNDKFALQIFKLKTVTYDTACALYLATRTLNQLAIYEVHSFPGAAKVVLNYFYVYGLLSGSDNLFECN